MDKKSAKKSDNRYWLRYVGMAGQMIGIILLGALLAQWLDSKFHIGQVPVALIILFFVIASLYISLKDFIIKKP